MKNNRSNGIMHYLSNYYNFVDSYNNAQSGFIKLAEGYGDLLAQINKDKTAAIQNLQSDLNTRLDELSRLSDTATQTDRNTANGNVTKAENAISVRETKYESRINEVTPIVNAIQQQVKTNASGAAILPQIGEAVLSILSKAVELASSIRV